MSPRNIIEAAAGRGINIIGITDHNSTRNALLARRLGAEEGILVLAGAEVTTREEIHCLTFFEEEEELSLFQSWIEENLTRIPNSPSRFGYQVVLDEDENIVDEIEYLLLMSLTRSIDELERKVHELNGLFIPAHVDRKVNSILSQLGFFPPAIRYDAIEITPYCRYEELLKHHSIVSEIPVIRSSDSHFLPDVGKAYTNFLMEGLSFSEIRLALCQEGGRKVTLI
jgi:PHP family Zn ribbon phosphoesterase